jgi:hypothetical protein
MPAPKHRPMTDPMTTPGINAFLFGDELEEGGRCVDSGALGCVEVTIIDVDAEFDGVDSIDGAPMASISM